MSSTNIAICETKPIFIIDYPFAEFINPKLHSIIAENSYLSDRGTMQTDWFSNYEEFRLIAGYVKTFLQLPRFRIGIHNTTLVLTSLWGMIYNHGDHQTVHDHLPCHWAFVYYVNVPNGSPPLVFDDCSFSYSPKSGQIIIFPASLRHHVPESQVSGRSNVVGNFYFQIDPSTLPNFGDI